MKEYVPPPPPGSPRRCRKVDWYPVAAALTRYELTPENSLPERVRLDVAADMAYGDFIGLLQGALHGGATTLELAID